MQPELSLQWRQMPIPYRFQQNLSSKLLPTETKRAIRAAFSRWTDVRCGGLRTSLRFTELEETTQGKPLIVIPEEATPQGKSSVTAPDNFGIYFRDVGWPDQRTVDRSIAVTHLFHGRGQTTVNGADMEINTSNFRFFIDEDELDTKAYLAQQSEGTDDRKDLEAVLTHEVGHYIGLAHSNAPLALMNPSDCGAKGRCEEGRRVQARRLSDDEQDAICQLYPPGAEPTADPTAGGCQTASNPAFSSLFIGLCVLGATCLRRQQSRRASASSDHR
jgi:Matrixin